MQTQLTQSLIDKFPAFDPTWPMPAIEAWFTAFERLFNYATRPEPSAPPALDPSWLSQPTFAPPVVNGKSRAELYKEWQHLDGALGAPIAFPANGHGQVFPPTAAAPVLAPTQEEENGVSVTLSVPANTTLRELNQRGLSVRMVEAPAAVPSTGGRGHRLTTEQLDTIKRLTGIGETVEEIASLLGIHPKTVERKVKIMQLPIRHSRAGMPA
jgi:hypothetical protein